MSSKTSNKGNVTGRALRVYHGYNPRYFPTYIIKAVFHNASPYFNLWMSAEIVTALYGGRAAKELYLLTAVTVAGNFLLHIVGAVLGRMVGTQQLILHDNEAAAYNHKTLSLDYDKLENPQIRRHRHKIIENSWINYYGVVRMRWRVECVIDRLVNILFSLALFAELFVLIGRAPFGWEAILLLAVLTACVAFHIHFQSREARLITEENRKIGDVMLEKTNRMNVDISCMDSRIYCQQRLVSRLWEEINKKLYRVNSHASNVAIAVDIPILAFEKLSELCFYLIVCLYCSMGLFPVGSVIKYVGYLSRITGSIGGLLADIRDLKSNEPFLQTYLDYFDIKNDMYQGSLAVEKRSDKKFDIEFKNVSFKYAGQEEYALKNIDLKLKVGERLAVVGMNGSGKTTFIKLLCRLYDPVEGEIYMNDFNIRKYDYRQYLELFSVVFQDYTLLSLPLGNNVASAAEWDTVKAEKLLEEVGFGERYAQMPGGLETPLYKDFDQDGVNVSGGEAQKIALARALYRDAPFIILDEPTAALDPIAEAEIYSRFDEIVGDKTAIYISHRLSSCRFCDKIAVFDKGRIVQLGTHEELLADAGGKYYELWNAQAQYYAGEEARDAKGMAGQSETAERL